MQKLIFKYRLDAFPDEVCLLILKLVAWGEKMTVSLSSKGIVLSPSPSNAVLGFFHVLCLDSVTLYIYPSFPSLVLE